MNRKTAKTRGWTLNLLNRWWVPVDFLDRRLVARPVCPPFWFPACAGMTLVRRVMTMAERVMTDVRLRPCGWTFSRVSLE